MRARLSLLLFFLPVLLFSQDTTAAPKRKIPFKTFSSYLKDTIVPAGPNEILVNIGPVFTTLLGGYPDTEARFSIFYKHALKNPRNYLRCGLTYKPEIDNPFFATDDLIFQSSDSVRIRNVFNIGTKKPLQVNLGFERRSKGQYRWTTYAALDLVAGFYNRRYELLDIHERLDSTGDWTYDYNMQNGAIDVLSYKNPFYWYVGFSPNVGLRYAFTSHWLMSVQAGFEAYYLVGRRYERDTWGNSLEGSDVNSFELYSPGLFNEFAITYRF